jgi:alkylglycerol monooxygenase
MEQYGKILLIAMPIFFLLVMFETLYGHLKQNQTVRNMDMVSSLSSGITNVIKDVLKISVSIITYEFLLQKLAIYHLQSTILMFCILFVALDFQGYWIHRWSHKINIFWNKHAIHHSSEEFNLACALRQSVSSFVNLFTFFLIPCAILGIPSLMVATVSPIHLFAQFWYHTRHINRMGFIENILVTPSHHRVHHAMNIEYMDKNFAQIFIIWDKLFGTFQEEMDDVPPVYGITRPSETWNPLKINFHHLFLLISDAWRTENLWDKCRIWFMPTGWRPADVEEKFPVSKVENVYEYVKYDTKASTALHTFVWVQLFFMFFLVFYFFGNIGLINGLSPYYIFWYGGFVILTVYSYAELMDRNRYALAWESTKNIIGLSWIYTTNDWFGMNNYFLFGKLFIAAYFVISTLVTAYFVFFDFKNDGRLIDN